MDYKLFLILITYKIQIMKKMFITIGIIFGLLIFWALLTPKKQILEQKTIANILTMQAPDSYVWGFMPLDEIPSLLSVERELNPYFKDYSKKIVFGLSGDYHQGFDVHYFRTITAIAIYKQGEPMETEEDFLYFLRAGDIENAKSSPEGYLPDAYSYKTYYSEGPPLSWSRVTKIGNYSIKNATSSRGLIVSVYTRNNIRLALLTSTKKQSSQEQEKLITTMGNSVTLNEASVAAYFAAAENMARQEQLIAEQNVTNINSQLQILGCVKAKTGTVNTCQNYLYGLSRDGQQFYFVDFLFTQAFPGGITPRMMVEMNNLVDGDQYRSNKGTVADYRPGEEIYSAIEDDKRLSDENTELLDDIEQKIKTYGGGSVVTFYYYKSFYLEKEPADLNDLIKKGALLKDKYGK